tara:strand:+ start:17403 stop:18230 length:828 start_codon:yes stop_codon:yes gene_type:complete
MKLAIGTGGLDSDFSEKYWQIFLHAIENQNYIHTALNYSNVDQYFKKASLENIKISKTIIKIEINRNPIKKILNIPRQINLILDQFKIDKIDTLQICNNPDAGDINMFFLKNILNKYKKKGLVNNFFLECFDPFSENLNKLIKDDFFEGYIFKLNCLQRSASKFFFENIINSKKKIISISPLAGGNFNQIMNNFDIDLKNDLDEIMKKNNIEDYYSLNIAFLKTKKNIEHGIFGTKNMDRLLKLKSDLVNIKPLKNEDFQRVLVLQDKYKSTINF